MSIKINCCMCNKYLGEIRDAKIRKDDVYYICSLCKSAAKLAKESKKHGSVFGDIFGR